MANTNSGDQVEVVLDDEQSMIEFGGKLSLAIRQSAAPLLLFLNGDLGAGKTTLSRGILLGLGHQAVVKSPTYTLVEPYDLAIGRVYHFDLYRLIDPEELEHIGFSDYLSEAQLCMIEWPENGDGYISEPDIRIDISQITLGRRVVLNGITELGEKCLNQLLSE